jgi:protein-L-isoaspartate(D-aspartate) O-methyltransferase
MLKQVSRFVSAGHGMTADKPSAQRLVDELKRKGDLRDPTFEAAFLAVPRHLFLPNVPLEEVYKDDAIPTKRDPDGRIVSSSSQPTMMLIMLEQLRLRRGHNVLEIGTGTGYNAAIMQHIVEDEGRVTTIELDIDVARQAEENLQRALMRQILVVTRDGAQGYPPRASYDRILVTAGIWDVTRAWVQQLRPDGILVAPLWLDAFQVSAAFRPQRDGTLYSSDNRPCGFVPLRGGAAGQQGLMQVGNAGLFLNGDVSGLDSAAIDSLLSDDAEDNHLGLPVSASEYWQGFMSYVMLHVPPEYRFVGYSAQDEHKPYGIEGQGFALLTRGSACFVPLNRGGAVRCFAGADAFLLLHDLLTAWDKANRPGVNRLRLLLTPLRTGLPAARGKQFVRREHVLQAWYEEGTS